MAYTLAELAKHVNGTVIGDCNSFVSEVATLETAREGQLSFLANRKYLHRGQRLPLARYPRGAACLIHSGAVLGADGFGIAREQNQDRGPGTVDEGAAAGQGDRR